MPNRNRLSQEEMEQPAKVYQVIAVADKVDEALEKLKTIVDQTTGVVTQAQLTETKLELKKYIDDEVADAEKRVIDKFSPMQKALNKGVWVIIGIVASVITQVTMMVILFFVSRE